MAFIINATLPSKIEPLDSVTSRYLALLDGLSTIDPELSEFVRDDEITGRRYVPRDHAALERWMFEENCFNGEAKPNEMVGCIFSVATDHDYDDPRRFIINTHAGGIYGNRVMLSSSYDVPPDPRLTDYRTVKAVLFAMADAFGSVFAYADPGTLGEDWAPRNEPRKPVYACWMMLILPDLARQIVPPPGTVTQVRPDGSLFMAATDDEHFDAANPEHRAAAFAMKEAIAPINDDSIISPRLST